MVVEREFGEIFKETPDGRIQLASDAPVEITDAITEAKNKLSENNRWAVVSVGKPRRSLEFGAKEITLIQTPTATIFARDHEKGQKILAAGVSQNGPLSEEQVLQARRQFLRDADLSPEEKLLSHNIGKGLDSLRQAKDFIKKNTNNTQTSIGHLKALLDSPKNKGNEIIEKTEDVEFNLHNLLSSVYTFTETMDETLRELGKLEEMKHHNQRYQDTISTAIGLRHCIQHNVTLRVHWMAKYDYNDDDFKYTVGIPLRYVKLPRIYTDNVYDATGDQHEPVEYYYGDIDSFLIDIEKLSELVAEKTEEIYSKLISEIDIENLEGVQELRQYFRLGSFGVDQSSEY